MMTMDPEDDPKIPLQYVAAYKDCNYLDLKQTASVLISMVTKFCGGIKFDIVEEYGESISTDNIGHADKLCFSIPTNENMSQVNSDCYRKCSDTGTPNQDTGTPNQNADDDSNNKIHAEVMEITKHGMVTTTHAMVVMSKNVTNEMDESEIMKHLIENRIDPMDIAKEALVSTDTMVCMKNTEETEKKDNSK